MGCFDKESEVSNKGFQDFVDPRYRRLHQTAFHIFSMCLVIQKIVCAYIYINIYKCVYSFIYLCLYPHPLAILLLAKCSGQRPWLNLWFSEDRWCFLSISILFNTVYIAFLPFLFACYTVTISFSPADVQTQNKTKLWQN